MPPEVPSHALSMRSLIRSDCTLELSLAEVPVPVPDDGEVLVRVEAAPINPSDMGLLFGPADMTTAKEGGSDSPQRVTADVPEHLLKSVAARVDQALPCGNEGAGVVVAAGSSDPAQALLGKTVAVLGGAMYAQYRVSPAALCLAASGRYFTRRRGLMFREPPHGAGHGRDHETRGTHGSGPHRCGFEPRADARQTLHRRRNPTG